MSDLVIRGILSTLGAIVFGVVIYVGWIVVDITNERVAFRERCVSDGLTVIDVQRSFVCVDRGNRLIRKW